MTEKDEKKKIHIISLVGQRATAVVMPIKTLFESDGFDQEDTEITLLHTDHTLGVADKCNKYFNEKYPNCRTNPPAIFRKEDSQISELCKDEQTVYYNVNPGMKWQVAYMCMKLPESTRCLASDTETYYQWNLMNDVKDTKGIPLTNLGLESYFQLSDHICLKEQPCTKRTLHADIQQLVNGKSFSISLKGNKDISISVLNDRLLWVNEHNGRLHLLFDFLFQRETPEAQRTLNDHYRLVTTVFSPIEYDVTIVSNSGPLISRAIVDGYDYIDVAINNMFGGWKIALSRMIQEGCITTPKSISPSEKSDPPFEVNLPENGAKTLVVMLGDNVETTLKAIFSHVLAQCSAAIIFYDTSAIRIVNIAGNMQQVLLTKGICAKFIPTDHKGRSIVEKICAAPRVYVFNVTPGTKMQIASLAVAARKLNQTETSLYSINNNELKVEPVAGYGESLPIVSPEVEDILECQIAKHRKLDSSVPNEAAWIKILTQLVSSRIKPRGSITEMAPHGIIIKNLDKSFLDIDHGGIWWEAVVAVAIKNSLGIIPYWQVTWDTIEKKREKTEKNMKAKKDVFLSELDVVFSYDKNVVVVSCKTGAKNLGLNAYQVKSEAKKRFGRFALPFLAVPHEKADGEELNVKIIDGVGILTPAILSNKDKLEESIKNLKKSLSTTTARL